MRFIDTHLHTHMLSDGAMVKLAMSGMDAAILPMPDTLSGIFNADAVLGLWERFLNFEVKRGKGIGYEAFIALSVPFQGLDHRAIEECLKELPSFLNNDRVVAMGEIGMDTGTDNEQSLFRIQLQIAKEHNLPVMVHTPIRLAPHASEITRKIVDIIKEENFDINRVVLDHTGENTFDLRLNSGAMVGLSVCYDKLPPEIAANYVVSNPDIRDKLLINTEVAAGDGYFTIQRVVLTMKQSGMKYEEIEKVVYENPKGFFNLSLD